MPRHTLPKRTPADDIRLFGYLPARSQLLAEHPPQGGGVMRYLVGCAGQFAMHSDTAGIAPLHGSTDDIDEAFAACDTGPVGCEVFDTQAREWIGPCCQEEIDEAKARLAARKAVA